jgi:polysaccharide export outer membrane protein
MKCSDIVILSMFACGRLAMAAETALPGGAPAPRAEAIVQPEAAAVSAPVPLGGYKLQPGDVLIVSVWKETDLQSDVLIRPDGGISFPLAGELPAAGRTVAELNTALEGRVRKFIPDAVVTVTVKSSTGNRIYVVGKVAHAGDFPLIGSVDIVQALSMAGGATPFADTNAIRVLRREGAQQVSIRFRYGDIEHGRRLSQNILLQSGDTVVVP